MSALSKLSREGTCLGPARHNVRNWREALTFSTTKVRDRSGHTGNIQKSYMFIGISGGNLRKPIDSGGFRRVTPPIPINK